MSSRYTPGIAPRDPSTTRRRLLEAGQLEVYLHGFQAAHLDDILQRAGVTKGAFFHHFASKAEFGYALVDEVLAAMIAAQWVTPLQESNSPDVLEAIAAEFERGVAGLRTQRPILGCPLNNLAQEMNPLDDAFRLRTTAVFDLWTNSFQRALERARAQGAVRASVDAGDTAHALVAQIEGTLSLARNSQDPDTLTIGARGLRRYLESLRA
ncbi:MAG TPA: TetR/AcrR family transcriptional regulator [Chloroflexota bacterium]|nr:TetR/AcrR family transcriptional regulator [Chloroflexota bacterium]